MKQRNIYQLPLNWRKRKRYLEKELIKIKKKEKENNYDEVMKELIGEEEYKKLQYRVEFERWNRMKQLEDALKKLKNDIEHRYESAFVSNNKLITCKITPHFNISYCGRMCGGYDLNVERRRLNTAYVNEESNYMTSCIFCYLEAYKYYEDLWADYYASIL